LQDQGRSRDPQPTQPLSGEPPDVLIRGASFAGLAVARELAGVEADVLALDRYGIALDQAPSP
jgi:hypothetical protein